MLTHKMDEEPVSTAIRALEGSVRRLMWRERVWLRDSLRDYDLDIGPFVVLGHIAHMGGQATMGALVKHMEQPNATMTGNVDRLEKNGLVVRKFGNEQDRRQVMVMITPKGKTLVNHIGARRREYLTQMAAHMTTNDLTQLAKLLECFLNGQPDQPENSAGQ